jgi:hypothetical protein
LSQGCKKLSLAGKISETLSIIDSSLVAGKTSFVLSETGEGDSSRNKKYPKKDKKFVLSKTKVTFASD